MFVHFYKLRTFSLPDNNNKKCGVHCYRKYAATVRSFLLIIKIEKSEPKGLGKRIFILIHYG